MATPDEYYRKQQEAAQDAARQAALIASQPLTKSPDEYAQSARLAKTVNLPTAVIDPNYKTFAQRMTEKRNETVLGTAPKLTSWITRDDNYKIAADDIEPLAWWENFLVVPRGIASAVPAFNEGAWGFAATVTALPGKNSVSDYFGGLARTSRGTKESVAGPTGGWLGRQVQGASQSVGMMAPGIIASIASGGAASPAVAAAYIAPGAISQGGTSAMKALEQGKSAAQSLQYGLQDAAAEAIFEKLPVGKLLGDIAAGTGFGKLLVNQIAREVPTEIATTLYQNLNEYANLTPDKPFGQFLAEQPEAVRDTIAQTVLATVGVAGAAAGARRIIKRTAGEEGRAAAAEANQQMIGDISTNAQASALRNRMPDSFREYVDQALAGGPVENVYVPAQDFVEYFQGQGIDPYELADELDGVSRDDLDAALAGGSDLRIPTATYAAKIAGTDADPFLMENMRFSPDEMTAREAADFNTRSADIMQEAWVEAERIRTQEESLRGAEEQIYTEMQSRLRMAGRTTDVANAEATLYPAFYRVMAERSGMTTEQFLASYPLPKVEGVRPEGMQTKDVAGFNRMLAEARGRRDVKADRGQSLLEFIAERGGINDVGGELRARDAQTVKRGKGKKALKLARDAAADGQGSMLGTGGGVSHSVDSVAMAAVEAGFMADNPDVAAWRAAQADGSASPDLTRALWEAIDEELRGNAQFAVAPGYKAMEREGSLDELEAYLDSLDVSLDMSDADILAAVRQDEGARKFAQAPATDSDAFKAWFGDSKVVDKSGKPLTVYHGSPDARDITGEDGQFATLAQRFGVTEDGGAFFFTSDRRVAATYADDARAFDYQNAEPAIVPAFLAIQNPMVLDWGGKTWQGTGKALKEAREAGHDGLIVHNVRDAYQAGVVAKGDHVSSVFVAFEPAQIKSVNNRGTFDRADPRLLFQDASNGPRGSIQFPAAGLGNGDTIIRLSQRADLSTFLHESGHYFLTVMQDMAEQGDPVVAGEFETIKAWWRENADDVAKDARKAFPDLAVTPEHVIAAIDNGTTGDTAIDLAIDTGMQEQWARSFEQYVMEGKSPSADLRTAFERFRAWLISIYRSLAGLNVTVSDDLRRVFDRMLATDEEIAQAQQDAGGSVPMFATAEEMGLTPEEFERFQKLRGQAEDEAKARLLKETMAPIKREREKWFKDERATVRETVERRVNSIRQYRAIEWMGNRRWFGEGQPAERPDMRWSKDILVERYGEGILKTLPRGKQTIYAVDGGLDPDEAAGWFGFDSGDEMLRAMEQATPRKDAIEAETDKVMYETHGDVLLDGSVEEEALAAVHNDKRGDWLAAELKAVTDVAGLAPAMTAKQSREVARQTIARMKVRDAMAANRFLAAERKAGQEAAKLGAILAREGIWMGNARRRIATKARAAMRDEGTVDAVAGQIDHANASTENYNETVTALIAAKQRQLLNHALYSEARKVTEEVGKAERFVQSLNKASKREKIAGAGRRDDAQIDYLSAIDEIMDRYDFRRMSGRAEDRRGSLNAFVEAMKAAGRENELSIPDDVLANSQRSPYKTIPVEELRGVIDSLKNLEHVALRWNKLIDGQLERELDQAVGEVTDAFESNIEKRPPGRVGTKGEALRNAGRQFLDLVLNATTILREIDGFKDFGFAYRNIKAPIDAAMNRLITRKEKAANDLDGLYDVYSKDERRAMAVRKHMPELGYALSKWEMIAVALNTGNEGNYQRLTDERVRGALTDEQVRDVVATLDERDAKFVQSVWDYLETFRPDIAARERRTTGVEPKWVEAKPVEIAGKALKGGYYPLRYDPRLSSLARDDETQNIAEALQAGRFGKAQTRNGHTKERAQSSGRDVDLDMGVLHKHVNQVIYDIELSEPVANSWRILQNKRVRDQFIQSGKQADFDALETWLKDVAEGQLGAADWMGRSARMLKSNFTAAKLAFNLSTVAVQITGLSQSMVIVGKRDFVRGLQAALRMGVGDEIAAKSSFMKSRQTTFNKDINDFYSDPKMGPVASRWGDIKREVIGPMSFWLMTKVQWHTVDIPTWLAGYQKGLRKFGNDEAQAIAYADDIVKRAQASGLFSDRSAIERGSVSRQHRQNDVVRLFTTLGSYMFAKFNVAYERSAVAAQTVRREGVSLRSAQEVLSWTLDMAFLFTLEAVIMAAIKGGLPSGDDEDKDGWLKFLAKQTGFSVMGTVPFVRDGASALQGFDGGGAYGSAVSTATKGAAGAYNVLTSPFTEGGEIKRTDVKNVINGAGLATGLPSTQVNRFVDAAWRQSEGDEVSPVEYLLGKSHK